MSRAQIYLASASPRRRELLDQIGISYQIVPVGLPEQRAAGESPEQFVTRLALEKAYAGKNRVARMGDGDRVDAIPVLGADTAVVLGDEILGKPAGSADAIRLLKMLSGRSHLVMTGVALVGSHAATRLSITRVFFGPTTPQEREAYCASGEPLDKAGAYAIQGHAAVFISRIEGSYSGVMGLPLYETSQLLDEFGIRTL